MISKCRYCGCTDLQKPYSRGDRQSADYAGVMRVLQKHYAKVGGAGEIATLTIAHRLKRNASTVNRQLIALEEVGLVVRESIAHRYGGGRYITVRLTREGHRWGPIRFAEEA